MLPATARLTRAQCSHLLNDPSLEVAFNRLGTLKYIKNLSNKGLSVITGAKIQKKAVARNKVRRQLYTLFKYFYEHSNKTPIIGMLYVSKHVYDMSYDELKQECNALFTKTQKNP